MKYFGDDRRANIADALVKVYECGFTKVACIAVVGIGLGEPEDLVTEVYREIFLCEPYNKENY